MLVKAKELLPYIEGIKRVPEDEGVNALIQLIKDDGKWIDP